MNFTDTFQTGIEKLTENIRSWLTNLLTGVEILQKVLSQLVAVYTQFETMVRKHCHDQSVLKDLITVGKLTHHVKKCKLI